MSEIQNNLWPGWETVRLIGRGSFGAVYEIQRDVFGDLEKAALKVISIPQNAGDIEEMYSDGYDDESITSTFQSHLKSIVAEYSLMRKMNGSSNIVNCDDVRYVQHDDGIGWDIFIKMELLTPLTKALPNDVLEEAVVQIAMDMCAALELCKRHEIVHRDIKPQNIFISPNGDYKLGDFGIAKTVEKTMGGTKIGTYKYMAPEVYNNHPYGSTADIYSLGLVLYWLLNERRMPFMPLPPTKLSAGQDEQARLRRLSGEPLPAPIHGSPALKRVVLKACAYDPKDRYSSASAMLAELSNIDCEIANIIPMIISEPEEEQKEEMDNTVGVFSSCTAGRKPDTEADGASLNMDSDETVGFFAKTGKEPASELGKAASDLMMHTGDEDAKEEIEPSAIQDAALAKKAWQKKATIITIACCLFALFFLCVLGQSSNSPSTENNTATSRISYGPWSNWSYSPVVATSTREVQTKQVYVKTRYRIAHYCSWGATEKRYITDDKPFSSNYYYHELGWFESLDSFERNGNVVCSSDEDGYRCTNGCRIFYIMDTEAVYELQYRYRTIYTD